MCVYIYIYIYRERERERGFFLVTFLDIYLVNNSLFHSADAGLFQLGMFSSVFDFSFIPQSVVGIERVGNEEHTSGSEFNCNHCYHLLKALYIASLLYEELLWPHVGHVKQVF